MFAERLKFIYGVRNMRVRFPVQAVVFGRRAVCPTRLQELNHAAAVLAAITEHATTDRERRAIYEGVTP